MKERSPAGFRSRRLVGRLRRERGERERENWPVSFRAFQDIKVNRGREQEKVRALARYVFEPRERRMAYAIMYTARNYQWSLKVINDSDGTIHENNCSKEKKNVQKKKRKEMSKRRRKEQNEREREQEKRSDGEGGRGMEEKKEKICPIESNEDLNYSDKIKRMTLINRTDNEILIGRRKRTGTSAIYDRKYIRV